MNYLQIIILVSKELDLPEDLVDKTYKAYWLSIRNFIKELPLKEDLTEDQFALLRTNINIPSLGKLNCTYDRMLGMKKRLQYINNIKDKNGKSNC